MKNEKLSAEAIKIRNLGWKRGSLIKIDSPIEANAAQGIIKPGIYLLVSQDCDIQTPPLFVEPYVEIVLCSIIEKPDGNYTRGKNPRIIHIPCYHNESKIYIECQAKNRFFLERHKLLKLKPYNKITIHKQALADTVDWLIKRYTRDAFPDSFNARRDMKALKKIIKNSHENIKYICVMLQNEDELPKDRPYQIFLHFLIDEETSETAYQQIEIVQEKIISELEKNDEILVISSEIRRLEQISLNEFLTLRHLDFDDLSSLD